MVFFWMSAGNSIVGHQRPNMQTQNGFSVEENGIRVLYKNCFKFTQQSTGTILQKISKLHKGK